MAKLLPVLYDQIQTLIARDTDPFVFSLSVNHRSKLDIFNLYLYITAKHSKNTLALAMKSALKKGSPFQSYTHSKFQQVRLYSFNEVYTHIECLS